MVNRDPVQPGSQILFHPDHQTAGQGFEVIIVRAILGADDDAELMPIAPRLIEPGIAINLVGVRAVKLSPPVLAGGAVAFDVAHMGFRAIEALAP